MFPQTVVIPAEADESVLATPKKTIADALAKAEEVTASRFEKSYKLEQIGKDFEQSRNSVFEYADYQITKLTDKNPELEKATKGKSAPSEAEAPVLNYQMSIILGMARRWDGKAAADYWQNAIDTEDRHTLKVLSDVIGFLEGVDSDGKRVALADDFRITSLREKTKLMLMTPAQKEAALKLTKNQATIQALKGLKVHASNFLGPRFVIDHTGKFVNAEDHQRKTKFAASF